ncbi:MAG: radical SAM protein [Pseudonocardiaceae bacterium]
MQRPTDEGTAQLSRYLRTRERGAWTAVFHELHPEPWFVSSGTWSALHGSIDALPSLVSSELRQRGLLISSAAQDGEALAAAEAELARRLDRASVLYLVLVQGCNFACSYCPIPELARETGNVIMDPDTARAAIDLWARHIRDDDAPDAEYVAILYGGEPLLNEPALRAAIEHIEKLQAAGMLPADNLSLMVCTNGLLVDRKLARFFAAHSVSVAVGCDGPAEAHDAIRRDTHGNTTYAQVETAIRTLVEEDVITFASASITPHNVAAIDHFSEFFAGLGVAKFGFNFLRGKLLLRLVPREDLTEYYEAATDGVVNNFDNFGGQHLEYQLERKHLALLQRRYFPTDCNGYGNQLVIEPNGQIGNCPFIRSDMANVRNAPKNFRIRDHPTVQHWRGRLPLYNPDCAPCDAKSICGAGCAWNALELKGDPLAVDDAMCLLTRKVFDRLIWSDQPTEAADHVR